MYIIMGYVIILWQVFLLPKDISDVYHNWNVLHGTLMAFRVGYRFLIITWVLYTLYL